MWAGASQCSVIQLAGADIDDEYISRTAQHQTSQLYNSHAKEEGETFEGYNQQIWFHDN